LFLVPSTLLNTGGYKIDHLLDISILFSLFGQEYAGVPQRWLLIFSEKAYEREMKTFRKNLKKEFEKERNRTEASA
jgi:hypothetical protein